MEQKKVVITAKEINDNGAILSSWIWILASAVSKATNLNVTKMGWGDLKKIESGLKELWIYPASISYITLSVSIDKEAVHISVDGLFY